VALGAAKQPRSECPFIATDALAGERRAHDDDAAYPAYVRRRKGPERPQSSASHVRTRIAVA
jgi:hypothetical protein